MQTLIDSTGPFQLPTHWGEVSTAQFCATDPLRTVEQRASYFAGRPIQVNGLVADLLAWMMQPPPTDGANKLDLEQQTYLQVELIRAALAKFPLHDCLPIVWGLYMAKRANLCYGAFHKHRAEALAATVMDEPITSCWGDAMHCLSEINRIAEKYRELSEPDPTEAARRAREAGADELLGAFGYKNVIKAVAPQMHLTEAEVENLPWQVVAEHLLYARRTAILQDNIQRNANNSQSQ